MDLYVSTGGTCRAVYDESVDLRMLGEPIIRRASHVEPMPDGQWTADLRPVHGPVLGPFPTRSLALGAEVAWLHAWFDNFNGELSE